MITIKNNKPYINNNKRKNIQEKININIFNQINDFKAHENNMEIVNR